MASIPEPLKRLVKKTIWYRFRHLEKQYLYLENQNIRRAEEAAELANAIGYIHTKKGLSELKKELSISPAVWGDEKRLEISEKAAVYSCFFNTNSGHIKIGDYTFAGSGVSILAGSHDPDLTGFVRRNSDFKEGYDIEIGNGVWLGSNSTILGPCKIEDNAVIAAGAVIVPGTHVGRGEM